LNDLNEKREAKIEIGMNGELEVSASYASAVSVR
jgi:hypothetical protein